MGAQLGLPMPQDEMEESKESAAVIQAAKKKREKRKKKKADQAAAAAEDEDFLDSIIQENKKDLVVYEKQKKEKEWWNQEWYINGNNKDGSRRVHYHCQTCDEPKSFDTIDEHRDHMFNVHGGDRYFNDLDYDTKVRSLKSLMTIFHITYGERIMPPDEKEEDACPCDKLYEEEEYYKYAFVHCLISDHEPVHWCDKCNEVVSAGFKQVHKTYKCDTVKIGHWLRKRSNVREQMIAQGKMTRKTK